MNRAAGWGRLVALAALVVGGLVVAPRPSSAADAPVLTASPDQVAFRGDEVITLTLTGCDGPTAPAIEHLGSIYEAPPTWGRLPVEETDPGTWVATSEAVSPGSDQVFRGVCGSGAVSPTIRVDVDWKELFTDPFLEGPGDALAAVVGTDCDPPAVAAVHFRVGERTWVVHPTVDARGDWRAVPPVIPRGRRIGIVGRCGDFVYIPTAWVNGGPPPMPRQNLYLDPGQGRPGTAFTGEVVCGTQPTITRYFDGDDVVTPVAVEPAASGSDGWWEFHDRAGRVDARYTVSCGLTTDHVTFDAITNELRFGPAGLAVDGYGFDPTTVDGTDCDAGRTVTVRLAVGFRPVQVLQPKTDEFGDWSVPLPADALRLGIIANASCGDDFDYETIDRNVDQWRTTTTTSTPSRGQPTEAAPAVAQRGVPSFTG